MKQKGWDFRTEMREDNNTVYLVTKVPELTLPKKWRAQLCPKMGA